MVTHQTGFPFSKHFSCSSDAETSRPQENALTGLFLDKKPRHAQPIRGTPAGEIVLAKYTTDSMPNGF
jgi:hypothetical protein